MPLNVYISTLVCKSDSMRYMFPPLLKSVFLNGILVCYSRMKLNMTVVDYFLYAFQHTLQRKLCKYSDNYPLSPRCQVVMVADLGLALGRPASSSTVAGHPGLCFPSFTRECRNGTSRKILAVTFLLPGPTNIKNN